MCVFDNIFFADMTKDEMLERFSPMSEKNNYLEAQKRIAKAMAEGKSYVYLPINLPCFSWHATVETITKLVVEDGFKLNEVWQPAEYYSIEWYD